MLEDFKEAINNKKIIQIDFISREEGEKTRRCIPLDYGPSRCNLIPNPDRYHFYDLDSPNGSHTLSIEPQYLMRLFITDQSFDPTDYVTWTPSWFVERDWGDKS